MPGIDRTKRFCNVRVANPNKFHKESFRVKTPNKDTRITVACPKKKWDTKKKRCKVGMKLQGISKRHKGKSCKIVFPKRKK